MGWTPWIAKETPDAPDFYQLTVRYLDGKHDTYNVVEHAINDKENMLRIFTHEDNLMWIPLNAVKSIEFDKAWTKLMELKKKFKLNEEVANAR